MLNRQVFLSVKRRLPVRRRSPYNIYLVFFSLAGVAFLLALTPIFFLLGQPLLSKTALALAAAMALNLGLWRLGMSGFWGQTIFEALMIAALVFCAWWTGGVASPILVFMSIVPLLPVYTTRNRTWVLFWLFIAFVSVAGLLLLQLNGIAPTLPQQKPQRLDGFGRDVLYFVPDTMDIYLHRGPDQQGHGAANTGCQPTAAAPV